ncbi:hypothetical protein QYE76_036646 [Lolium multiflorum]|uniref:DUF6598 domain-containing protein n=1 Tax=Lolium multiflorum TaxID=4521 RepID=A0AAD8R5A4_LOLMU|nr:hypothetical protein QYE76_036646 [Lolium multiflorum]
MSMESAAMKRGCKTEAEKAGRKKAAGVVRTRKPDISWIMHSFDRVDEVRLKRGVARLNRENPPERQIVLEDLTEEERAELLQQEKEWARKKEEVDRVKREADRLAKEAERARAPPPPEDPSKDKWQLNYDFEREHLEMKMAREPGFSGFSFEDNTRIPAMCFTDNPMHDHTCTWSTLQIFTVKVAGLEGLQLPLDVFGMVAVRDKLDYNRNIIFSRTRDNCQTLTQQDPCLVLTGPSRAVFYREKVYVEAVLKVKGTTESEDTDLSLLLDRFECCEKMNLCVDVGECRHRSCMSSILYTSKLSTLEFTCGLVASSVEATIAMQIVEGSWPEGLRCKLTACIGSLHHMDILLLDSGEEKVPVSAADGAVELSRRVVSVESYGQLIVRGMMRRGGGDHGQILAQAKASFPPLDADRSEGSLDLGMCKLKVTVAWSRILLFHPEGGLPLTRGSGVAVSTGSLS